MSNEPLNLLEQLSNLSSFEKNQANKLWQRLLATTDKGCYSDIDQKDIRKLFSFTKRFADCTQIVQ